MKKVFILFTFLFSIGIVMQAQERTITGTVLSAEDGQPIIGASVVVKGTGSTQGTITDLDGKFSLRVDLPATLIVSYVGMQNLEVAAANNMTITLQTSSELLEEVVVVAYGQQRKEAITGAVANVKSDKIERRPVAVATAVLEGQSPGVQVNNAYGEPGSTPTIRIRGFNSINGDNNPLYVVNGVPMGAMSANDINPADIESITVLKDAASSALYGNKAAAGVVLITTKSGRLGEDNVQIQATINHGIYKRGLKEYDRLDAYQWMEAYWMARRNALYTTDLEQKAGAYGTWSDANVDAPGRVKDGVGEDYNIFNKTWDDLFDGNGKLSSGTKILDAYADDLDWFGPMSRTGSRSDFNISARGGSKKSSYYIGAGYLKEEGFTKGSSGERFSGNARVDTKPTDWFKMGGSLNASYRENDYMKGDSDSSTSTINPFYYSRYMSPIYPVHLHDSETGDYVLDKEGNKQYDSGGGRPQLASRHIVWETELDKNKQFNTTIDMTGYMDFIFLKDFVFTIKGGMMNRNYTEKTYNNAIIGDGSGSGRMKKITNRYRNYMGQQLLNWSHTFNDVHRVEALLGHENFYYNREYNYLYKTDEKFPGLMELSNFTVMSSVNGYQQGYRTEGYFSRVGYSFDDKCFADFSFRRDGSSRFHKDNRWGNFWSIGGSWVISREEFMKELTWINNLKLRAAYGEVGKESSVDYYAWMSLYTSSQNGGKGAFYWSQFDAKDITWEKAKSVSVAIESRLFNRVNFSVEYFDKTSKDLLFDLTLPLSIGAKPSEGRPIKTVNFGSIANRGVEISADVDVLRTKDFKWNIGTNLSFMTNEVLELPEEYGEEGYTSGNRKYMKGKSIYNWYMYQYVGIDKSNGRSLYKFNSKNYAIKEPGYEGPAAWTSGDNRSVVGANDYTVIDGVAYSYKTTSAQKDYSGSSIPKVYGSFTTSLRYKDFELSGLFTFQHGGKVYDSPYRSLMGLSETPSAVHKDILKAWTPDQAGTGIDYHGVPALNSSQSSDNNATSNRFLISSDYFMIKNVTLSYNVPTTLLQRVGLKGLLLTASGENLGIFTKRKGLNIQQSFGGSINNQFPPAKVFSVGLNLKF